MKDPAPGPADFFRQLALSIVEAAIAVAAVLQLFRDE